MSRMLGRMRTIAEATVMELTRRRVLHILLLFALVVLGSAFLFTEFRNEAKLKVIKDFSLGAMTLFGLIIALLATAQIIPAELEQRTIYTILAKPVYRFEFLVGKFMGVATILVFCVLIMSTVFGVVLVLKGEALIAEQEAYLAPIEEEGLMTESIRQEISSLRGQTYDPRLAQAILLTLAKILLVAALALLISTFATSMIFTVGTTFMLYLIGNLISVAREALHSPPSGNLFLEFALVLLVLIVPDFSQYNLADAIAAGEVVPWSLTGMVLTGSLGYLIIYLTAGSLIFSAREL